MRGGEREGGGREEGKREGGEGGEEGGEEGRRGGRGAQLNDASVNQVLPTSQANLALIIADHQISQGLPFMANVENVVLLYWSV